MTRDRTLADFLCDRIEQIEDALTRGGLELTEVAWRKEEIEDAKLILKRLGREERDAIAGEEGQ